MLMPRVLRCFGQAFVTSFILACQPFRLMPLSLRLPPFLIRMKAACNVSGKVAGIPLENNPVSGALPASQELSGCRQCWTAIRCNWLGLAD